MRPPPPPPPLPPTRGPGAPISAQQAHLLNLQRRGHHPLAAHYSGAQGGSTYGHPAHYGTMVGHGQGSIGGVPGPGFPIPLDALRKGGGEGPTQQSLVHHSAPLHGMIPPPPPPETDDDEMTMSMSARSGPSVCSTHTGGKYMASGTHTPSSLPSIKVVKNDYNQHFVDTGERPQNFIRDHEPHARFTEYPKLARLIRLKDEFNRQRAHPPAHIRADLRDFDWSSLGVNFDVIVIDPPWREYAERAAALGSVLPEDVTPWSLSDMLQHLKVDQISEVPSFCFIWCGTSHLDEGRKLLQSWGFRRCEDICWCKTNLMASRSGVRRLDVMDEHGIFQRTKEHCLMGVKGVVRRSTDTHFIHSNIDTDVIVGEEPVDPQGHPTGSTSKPAELYEVIDRFCLGRRKLELFGLDRNIRPGWLTIGNEISVTNFDRERYASWVSAVPAPNGRATTDTQQPMNEGASTSEPSSTIGRTSGRYTGSTPEIDQLRPKSPPRSLVRSSAASTPATGSSTVA